MSCEHFIYIFDAPRGLATWRYGWHVSQGETLQPLLDAARWLLDCGLADPADRITAMRGGSPALTARVGVAAQLEVVDAPSRGPRFWRLQAADRFARLRGRDTPH